MIPNLLTESRIIFAIIISLVILCDFSPNYRGLGFCVFIAAALTDWLDGYIARKLGQVTNLGIRLDPIADKVLISIPLFILCFIYSHVLLIPMTIVVVVREAYVTYLRHKAGLAGKLIPAIWSGKIKMVVQAVTLASLLQPFFDMPSVVTAMMLITMCITAVSGVEYHVKYSVTQ
jgi:CDP-diacylglycerol--glycerol-3-phosphate 3-phosphatidyltransferase